MTAEPKSSSVAADLTEVVGDFLIRFFHQEPDDLKATIMALRAMVGHFNYEWELAQALAFVLRGNFPTNFLRDLIREKANRFAENDDQALRFLSKNYQDIGVDCAINFDDLLTPPPD